MVLWWGWGGRPQVTLWLAYAGLVILRGSGTWAEERGVARNCCSLALAKWRQEKEQGGLGLWVLQCGRGAVWSQGLTCLELPAECSRQVTPGSEMTCMEEQSDVR